MSESRHPDEPKRFLPTPLSILFAAVLLVIGVLELRDHFREPAAVVMPCSAVVPGVAPPAQWLELTGCTLDLRSIAFTTLRSSMTMAYVPVRADTDASDAPARFVLQTEADEFLDRGRPNAKVRQVGNHVYVPSAPVVEPPLTGRTLRGMVIAGRREDDDTREHFEQPPGRVSPGFA